MPKIPKSLLLICSLALLLVAAPAALAVEECEGEGCDSRSTIDPNDFVQEVLDWLGEILGGEDGEGDADEDSRSTIDPND